MDNFARYQRQLSLPQITPAHQKKLAQTKLVMVGAGGLGAPALPYLAAAGIGHITIIDHDTVDVTNLHRQTIYKENQNDQSKAMLAATYLKELNPEIKIEFVTIKLETKALPACDIILDGTDNFKTKTLLNRISIETATPLVSASVNQFAGQIGIFSGGHESAPCYHCLFSQLPDNARNCNEAGILGTSAGITGLYQAHLTLLYLLHLGEIKIGSVMTLDLMNMRNKLLKLSKDENCAVCSNVEHKPLSEEPIMTEIALVSRIELEDKDHIVIDVREDHELETDPIDNALHISLGELPMRTNELPQDKTLAFVCASNIRSRKAAEYFAALGFEKVCVLDKKSV